MFTAENAESAENYMNGTRTPSEPLVPFRTVVSALSAHSAVKDSFVFAALRESFGLPVAYLNRSGMGMGMGRGMGRGNGYGHGTVIVPVPRDSPVPTG